MAVRNYSIDKVAFSWGGLNLMSGIAEDSEISVTDTRSEKVTQKETGIDGTDVVQTWHPGKSAMVTISIDAESHLNQVLHAIHGADEIGRNSVATGTLHDSSSGDTEVLHGMRIQGRPTRRKGFSASALTWTFLVARAEYTPGLSNNNQVGVGVTPPDPIDADI